jgi:hypothetical protein
VTQWTRIGGVLVERDDLIKAISALRALPDSDTIIIKSLRDLASPLANTKYRLLADQYLRDHPEDSQLETTGLKHPRSGALPLSACSSGTCTSSTS